ncbi:MAG: hypothetical protein AMS15_09710 [Planctomycetes bacterium DG_23]|nr:MAG: hypothetical protein AMS15_09710 [Planctomycetes bacterium DG_23]
MNDWGRWGWVNDEGLITFWLAMQFFRTGREDYLEAFAAMARHVRDVDTVHTQSTPRSEIIAAEPYTEFRYTEYVNRRGTGHRHNVQHWGDGYVGTRVSISIAQRLYYYLTGDGRTRDVIDEVYESNVGPEHGKAIDSTSSILYSLLTKWELSGDEKYKDMFAAFLEVCYEYQEKSGGYFPSEFFFDYLNRKPLGEFDGKAEGTFYHYFGFLHALLDYYELTGDERLKEAFIRLAELSTEERSYGRRRQFLLRSIGYRLSGDEKYRQLILQNLQGIMDRPLVPREREDWIGPTATARAVSSMGFAIGGIPYAMEAIGSEEGTKPPERKSE